VIGSVALPRSPASSTQVNSSWPLSAATSGNSRYGFAAMPGDSSARKTYTPL
jgi:hypothetical protein